MTDEEAAALKAAADKVSAEAAAAADAAKKAADADDDDEIDDDEVGLNPVDRIAKRMIELQGGTYRDSSPEARVVKRLLQDTFKLRGKNTKLRERAVADGDVIVRKGTEADNLAAWSALGLTPAQVKEKLEQRDKFETTIKKNERAKFFDDVADALGYSGRGKKAFVKQIQLQGIDLQMKEVEVEQNGRTSKVLKPFAKLPTEPDEKLRPIDEYVETEMGELLPAFQAQGSDDPEADDDSNGSPKERRPHAAAAKFTPMVTQSGSASKTSEKAKARSTVDAFTTTKYGHNMKKK